MLDRIEELGKTDIDLQFVLPEGSNWSVDMMCVPTNCKNYDGAMDFINEVSGNKYYYPDAEVFSTLEVYFTSDALEEKYTELWNTVKASA